MAETKRPTSPAAEEILGGYFPVLDHGFVSLVDYMGTDEDIERAARVSYGYGTRKRSATRGLIRYLRRHAHTTPSEMVELKFHCAMPIFVARQWVRHRTACLAEGTEVYFDLPGGIDRRGNQLYKVPIEELWARFAPGRNLTRPDRQADPHFKRDRVRRMHLRQVDEDTLDVQHTKIVDVVCNGKKPVFKVTLADGKSIEATADHRFLFAAGWKTLKQALDLRERAGRAVWTSGDHYLYANGVVMEEPALSNEWTCQLCGERAAELHAHHIVPVWADETHAREESNLTTLCGECHRSVAGREHEIAEELLGEPIHTEWKPRPRVAWNKLTQARLVRIEEIEYVGVKQTYDLEVEGPHHNFIANGIVTHNSVNEYSGRYSLMPLLFYEPPPGSFALQSAANNQGRQSEPAEPALYAEAIERWERIRAEASDTYGWLVQENVARELARIDLPLSTYTQWYWKIDLHNLLHFLRLRVDPHAQWEIQEYGRVMAGMLERVAPLSYEAWLDYEVLGARVSGAELDVLRGLLEADEDGISPRDRRVTPDDLAAAGLSGREIRELIDKLQPVERPDYTLDLSVMRTAEEMASRMAEAVPDAEV